MKLSNPDKKFPSSNFRILTREPGVYPGFFASKRLNKIDKEVMILG